MLTGYVGVSIVQFCSFSRNMIDLDEEVKGKLK